MTIRDRFFLKEVLLEPSHTYLADLDVFVSLLKADSHDLQLMHAAAADGCVSAEIGNVLFIRTTHFYRSSSE